MTDAEFDIDEVFTDARLPRQSVPICLRGDLVTEWQELERKFKLANETADEDTLAASTSLEAVDLAKRMEELEEQMRAATRVFQLQAIPRSKWAALVRRHPPREGDQADFDRETFPVAAVAACTAVPKMTVEQAGRLADEYLTDGQWNTLFAHVWMMNTSAVDVPFSLAASAIRADTAPNSR